MGIATFVTDYSGSTTQFFLNLPFGETMVEQRTGAFDNWYRFNAKELDKETNLYYYGARYYNPSLSIWYGVDPEGGKMPGWSPYNYTFDNPIKYIDPDGREPKHIGFSTTVRADGTTVVTMTVTGKVINDSGKSYTSEQMSSYANRISGSLRDTYSGAKGDKFEVNVVTDISVVSADNPLTATDHAFRIVDNGKIPNGLGGYEPEGTLGKATYGENVVYLGNQMLNGTEATEGQYAGTGKTQSGFATLERTSAHEIGHSGNLQGHPDPKTANGNIMIQTYSPSAGKKVTEDQINQMESSKLNNGNQKIPVKQ